MNDSFFYIDRFLICLRRRILLHEEKFERIETENVTSQTLYQLDIKY